MKLLIIIFLLIHGLLHLVGASKVLDIALSIKMSGRHQQFAWIAACLLFIISALLVMLNKDWWWIMASLAVLLSQDLIIQQWEDAKYGTILNLIILVMVIVSAL